MTPTVLMLVTSDPRTSPRPAEAIRIAAGVGTWKKASVILYLHGPAVLALSEFVDELVDEDNFNRYLPILRDLGHPVYVEAGATHLADLGETPVPFQETNSSVLAALLEQATSVLRF
ncbi:MAG: hypothetical protein U1G08_07305 [Verrucomicrobiota bacterium]